MTLLGPSFPACKILRPPGMILKEATLFHYFQKDRCKDWKTIYYNVRVGKGIPLPDNYPSWLTRDWILSTQHRIDALIETQDNVLIVEVKSLAGRTAFGALLLYKQLYQKDPIIKLPIKLLVVSDFIYGQMLESFLDNGIEVYLHNIYNE